MFLCHIEVYAYTMGIFPTHSLHWVPPDGRGRKHRSGILLLPFQESFHEDLQQETTTLVLFDCKEVELCCGFCHPPPPPWPQSNDHYCLHDLLKKGQREEM
jgi:hypothetical protein